MENNEVETDNTQIEAETENTPEEVDDSLKPQKEAELSLTKEQKSKLDSFDRIYAENKELKAKHAPKGESAKVETSEKVEEWVAPSDPLEIVKLGKVLKDYDENETEFIIRNASSKDIDGIVKAEKDPMVQAAITATRDKVAKESKVPTPSSPSSVAETFDAEKAVKEGSELEEVTKRYEKLKESGMGEGM